MKLSIKTRHTPAEYTVETPSRDVHETVRLMEDVDRGFWDGNNVFIPWHEIVWIEVAS